MTSQITAAVKQPGREVSRHGHFRFNLAIAAAMPLFLAAGLPFGARANPILYIVTQNNISGTNPTSDTNTLMSVDLGAPLVGGIFTATAIGPTTLQGAGGQTAEIRGLAYDNIDGLMYGITAQGVLVTVNLNTGATIPLLTLPYYAQSSFQNEWSGMAFDGTENLYVVNASGAQELVKINLGSGPPALTLVGSVYYQGVGFRVPLQILGLAFSNGVLLGSDRSNDTLVTIDTATAVAAYTYGDSVVINNVQEIAFGPTGTLYVVFDHVASSDNAGLATFNFTPQLSATEIGELPFQIDFNGCQGCGNSTYGAGGLAFGPEGYVEVCKSSSTKNPVPANGIYSFTVSGSAFSSSANPLMVPVGECSGPIPVAPQTATITELPVPGVGVSAITAFGYSAPPRSQKENLLESYDLQTRTATVLVVPSATAGDTSSETIATFTNYEAPPGQLKVCKIAGAGVAANTPFTFTVNAGTPFTVEAGPLDQGGYCAVVPGRFEVGTSETVTETVPAGYATPAVTVNGASTPSAGCQPIPGCVAAEMGPGINEVSFTNSVPGQSQNMGAPFANLDMVNYSLVRQIAVTGTQSYMTYRADLLNRGTTAMGPITANLTSLDPSSVQVMGQGALNFASAPANSQVASSGTFTVLTNSATPLDFSKLSWTYQSTRSISPGH
ncbi:MAG: hypothetical protein ABSG56_26625 [Bryobacteraceae bacterium]|jgi:hypothetical protein